MPRPVPIRVGDSLRGRFQNGFDARQTAPIQSANLHQAVGKVANRSIATGVKPANCAKHWELLQNEVEISRWPAISLLQIGATVTAGLDRLALIWSIDVLVVARPSFALRVLLCSPSRLHFKPIAAAIRNLHEFASTLASPRRPQGVLRSEYFAWIVVQEDDSQFGRLLPMRLSDLEGWHPHYVLPAKRFPFEHEMIQPARMSVFAARLRALPNGDFHRHREFLEGGAILIVC